MGLDSVMFIEEVEQFFGISVPNEVAEKVGTVNELVDYIALTLVLEDTRSTVYSAVYNKVKVFILGHSLYNGAVTETQYLAEVLQPFNDSLFQTLKQYLTLELPLSVIRSKKATGLYSLFTVPAMERYDPCKVRVSDFCRCVVAFNYKRLLTREALLTRTDVLMAVMGLLEDCLGIDVYAIKAEHSFTKDMGID